MPSHVEVTILRQPICSECGPLGPLMEMTDGAATGIAVKHDALEHSGFASEGEDG